MEAPGPEPAGGPLPGRILAGRYRVLSLLGAGGMGEVYLCEHLVLKKKVAVKLLRAELAGGQEGALRFQREAMAASQIGHENIVDVYDFGRVPDGSFFYAMEAVQGETLREVLLREGPLPVNRVLAILAQVCRALNAAHARKIVHLDLKPENVMLVRREDGSDLVKVLDFGISKFVGEQRGSQSLTPEGLVVGTPAYMSPEQASGRAVDRRTDVYAVGVLAYEMLTGVPPFGDGPIAETLVRLCTEAPVPPSKLRADIPEGLESLVLRALEKRPEGRFSSMKSLGAGLTAILARSDLGPVFGPASEARAAGARARRRRLLGGAVAALAVAAAVAVAALRPWAGARFTTGPSDAAEPATVPSSAAGHRPESVLPGTGPAAAAPVESPRPAQARVRLRSVPPGASVFLGGQRLGVTPLEIELPESGTAEYRLRREGFATATRRISAGDDDVEVTLRRRRAGGMAGRRVEDHRKTAGEPELKPNPFEGTP